jgi:hypothetical protein
MISDKFDDEGIILVKEFAEDLPKINGDYHQLNKRSPI